MWRRFAIVGPGPNLSGADWACGNSVFIIGFQKSEIGFHNEILADLAQRYRQIR